MAGVEMGAAFWTATAIFVVSYVLIITEKVHKTVAALFGGALMMALGILSQREAFNAEDLGVDWNVIFLLISMMIIVNLAKPTGLFEYIAIRSAKLGGGRPFRIMAVLAVVTALLSALLDNVTTVLLIIPVTMFVADELETDPVPFLLAEAFASNIGGTATLIGDPPNIMIASKAGLDFMQFIYNLAPIIAIIMAAFVPMMWLMFGRKLRSTAEVRARVMAMDERAAIKDPVLLRKSLFVLGLVTAGFVFHGAMGYQPATVALLGAGFLLLITNTKDTHRVLAAVEWPTVFFFIGLFIIVGGVVKVGLIRWMSAQAIALTHGDLFGTSMLVMWFSAFASSIIDNIPFVATMNPLVIDMAHQLWPDRAGPELLNHVALMPVWWSLALGACLGGNGTAIGASANVIVVGMSEEAGRKISFVRFMAYGMPVMLMTLVLSTLYVWLRYYVLHI